LEAKFGYRKRERLEAADEIFETLTGNHEIRERKKYKYQGKNWGTEHTKGDSQYQQKRLKHVEHGQK